MTTRIIVGDALTELAKLPDESVHMCVTSPPYYGLRDYLTATWEGGDPGCDHKVDSQSAAMKQKRSTLGPNRDGLSPDNAYFKGVDEVYRAVCGKCGARRVDAQLGLEATPDEYVTAMVGVFREVRRTLRSDGTLWLNIGDSYAGGGNGGGGSFAQDGIHMAARAGTDKNVPTRYGSRGAGGGIKPKDMIGIPWMLAFALRADGWYLRSEITWAKRAPMPESVTDRPTSATEKVFLLSKSARYFYDNEAVKEAFETDPGENYPARAKITGRGQQGFADARGHDQDKSGGFPPAGNGRNMRNFWLLGPEPYPEAHFATFVSEIPRRAILAGTSERGVCPSCGAPWVRQSETSYDNPGNRTTNGPRSLAQRHETAGFPVRLEKRVETTGWAPSCRCHPASPIPAKVLDPFLGSGTTAMVADRLGRDCIGVELSPEYARMARRRIEQDAGMFAQLEAAE